jgi:type II secretory pathway pseudopilin PulG
MVGGTMTQRGAGGWVLLEVMAAVAVFAILVTSLVSGFLGVVERGARTEQQADGLGAAGLQSDSAWTWGDRALEAAWSPGPILNVRIAATGGMADAVVGVWADGWLMGEVSPNDSGRVILGASTWADRDGQELVIRAREADGTWGPPWRTFVPDVTGILVAAPGGVIADQSGGEATVHPPFAANPRFNMSGSGGAIVSGPSGTPFFATLIPPGPALVSLDGGACQSWLSEPGRGVDVYF